MTQQNCVQMNICIHVEYLVVMDMHFFHIMENHIIWRVKFSLVLKLPPNLHYQRWQTSPLLLSSATQNSGSAVRFHTLYSGED
jgi:hypothetical protein